MNTSKTIQLAVSSLILAILMAVTLIAVVVPCRTVSAADTFVMAYLDEPTNSAGMLGFHLFYTEAFRRLGMELTYKVYPPARASVMLNTGEVDGEASRIAGYAENYPNVVMVDEPIFIMKLIAVAKDPAIQLDTWEELRDSGYRVDYFRGIAAAENLLPDLVKAENLSAVSDPAQAMKKLMTGRTEIYIDVDARITALLASPEYQDSGIRVLNAEEEIPNYPYVHKRHADLAPRLAEVLKQMKAEGLFEQYMQQAQEEFAQK